MRWLLLCVLMVTISSLTTRGDLSMIWFVENLAAEE